ncbi:inositol-3-phosphate synthase [Micromonospora sp. M12]
MSLRQLHAQPGRRGAGVAGAGRAGGRTGRRQGRQDGSNADQDGARPAFRSRALTVEGWYSTNILGNRDGQILDDPSSLASKLDTKGSVLNQILGYDVDDHVVRIDYYRPRGDAKEAWDNVDLIGFLGQRMQLKVDFLCRDSILAAPLVLDLARLMAEAAERGERGAQEQLGYFFKAPMTRDGRAPEHALHAQERTLLDWLDAPA